MTTLLWHTVLTVVLLAWAYEVTLRVPYKPAWIWTGTALVILIGYLSLIAVSVFDSSPAQVQAVVGNVAATLMLLAGIACLVLFAAVSRGPSRAIAARSLARADVSGWAPRDEESVIVPDDEDGELGSVIDAGTWSSGAAVDQAHPGRHAFASSDDAVSLPPTAPARDAGPWIAPATRPATTVYQPAAAQPVAASLWAPMSSPEEEPEHGAPRRALPASDDGF